MSGSAAALASSLSPHIGASPLANGGGLRRRRHGEAILTIHTILACRRRRHIILPRSLATTVARVVVLCRVVSCRVVSCRVASRRVVSCRVVSCRVVSCRVVSPRARRGGVALLPRRGAHRPSSSHHLTRQPEPFSRPTARGTDVTFVSSSSAAGATRGAAPPSPLPSPSPSPSPLALPPAEPSSPSRAAECGGARPLGCGVSCYSSLLRLDEISLCDTPLLGLSGAAASVTLRCYETRPLCDNTPLRGLSGAASRARARGGAARPRRRARRAARRARARAARRCTRTTGSRWSRLWGRRRGSWRARGGGERGARGEAAREWRA